ncbi:P-loop containing nucleoside triphosphate hydrolase protein [Xylariales sp. AK1849]|nr:P-loop containing nucleoside triphosphate hydrolase protein [Xylariales sp. AK1849]
MFSEGQAATAISSAGRSARLTRVLKETLNGRRKVTDTNTAKLFLESAQNHQSPSACVETILASSDGLAAVRSSVRADLSLSFIQNYTLGFIHFLSDPSVKALADGQFLWQIILAIVDPPTLWNALCNVHDELDEQWLHPLAWLAHELLANTSDEAPDILSGVRSLLDSGKLLQAKSHGTRELAYKIQKVVDFRTAPASADATFSPGGRHDNDFADFRKIMVYPTKDELLATQNPFYLRMRDVFHAENSDIASIHLDNQFRLMREDMLAEIRNDLQIAADKKKGQRVAQNLGGLVLIGIEAGDEKRGRKCSLSMHCEKGLEYMSQLHQVHRRQFLMENRNYLKHNSFGALLCGDDIDGFAFLERDLDLLCEDPPIVCLRFTDSRCFSRALHALRSQMNVQFIVVDTPVFAHEPVLEGLKAMTELPLQEALIRPPSSPEPQTVHITNGLQHLVDNYQSSGAGGCCIQLGDRDLQVDQSQISSFVSAVTQKVSLIQGPPGTGKSFVGSWIAKAMFDHSKHRILVISYTNHALDQFLEDLIDVGIPKELMVRLGSKCSERTASLLLTQQADSYKRTSESWLIMDHLKSEKGELLDQLRSALSEFRDFNVSFDVLMEYLEFSIDWGKFYQAFQVPRGEQYWKQVGKGGKTVKPNYLLSRWVRGNNPGMFTKQVSQDCEKVWDMHLSQRAAAYGEWVQDMMKERAGVVQQLAHEVDVLQERLDDLFSERNMKILRSRRVIGCTTTGAAMQNKIIRAANPDVVIVEEAGEIREAHVLTALAPSVQQLILIGDHKQLRPKVDNYALTVEKGDGYNLNMSMFERMIVQGHSHTTLVKQHRMHPEISLLPRGLTYPGLLDGAKTSDRPIIRGIQDRVIFVNHEHSEVTYSAINDKRDPTAKASKQNEFEAKMVLRLVRYLAQQGYGTDKMVVLTPYLGQLRLLREILKEENDPVLNDLDSASLIQAGLMTQAASKVGKRPLRLSTIDNYQGEESDIIIISLTRSNTRGDIGFMSAPERLNVMITRARNCLIMIGNMDTFMSSKKERDTWSRFFELLKERRHLYDGFPVKCERHPEAMAILSQPEDFTKFCPDGGCAAPCGVELKCGLHKCKRRCHKLADHSQVRCTHLIERTCTRQHKEKVPCARTNEPCDACVAEDLKNERRIKRDLDLERKRLAQQAVYKKELEEIQDEREHQRRIIKYTVEEEAQKTHVAQQRQDLKALQEAAVRTQKTKQAEKDRAEAAKEVASQNSDAVIEDKSTDKMAGFDSNAREQWKFCKESDGAQSKSLDELMDMLGLEDIKLQFLEIKTTVDTKIRQNVKFSKERYGCSLLGNPGTGKTTVARLYAQFLTSLGVIPGCQFEETTGSKLANMGVSGCQTLVENMLNDGGGVIFIDEAYQLTSGNSPGGKAVLDYILAEVENLTGKIVFVLAGYNKQMESFYAHNPGLPSRFPISMKFADYTDRELVKILSLKINKRYNSSMKCEDGLLGLFTRIVVRRIGRGRGREGFGNARTVENVLDCIAKRQATRIFRERRSKLKPDDFLFTKADLIGSEPSGALVNSEGWKKLNEMVGLTSVKEAVKSLVDSAQENYERELAEQPLVEYSLNKVFLGNPGTGKTTVAKLYGMILVDLGLLSKGEVIVKNPSDFVDSVIGGSEKQTKGILASTAGKVLVIDEAYSLYGGGSGSGSYKDPFKTAVIDTIVAEVQSVPGDDRCVLLLGYKDQMEDMFQNVNPGLSRRFPISSAFNFEDFDDNQLAQILDVKLKQQGFEATGEAKKVAMEMLDRARNRPNFGNAGEIDIILNDTKARHQKRYSSGETKSAQILEALDFDENFNRAQNSETNVKKLFANTVGAEDTIALLEGYQETVRGLRAYGMNPKESIPFNFLFKGPPGTGKTTTAKKMGKVFYDMGFLATAEVIECSASDLVGQYVGQTGPKVRQLLDKALGKVLFIDEAYRLSEGHFAKEAIDELVDSVTKDKYIKKLIIILAGYDSDIDRLMSVNQGLTSRFPETVNFRVLKPTECVLLMTSLLSAQGKTLKSKKVTFNLSVLESPEPSFHKRVTMLFGDLSRQSGWASARDVKTLTMGVFNKTIKPKGGSTTKQLCVTEEFIIIELQSLYRERQSRSQSKVSYVNNDPQPLPAFASPPPPPKNPTTTATSTGAAQPSPEPETNKDPAEKSKKSEESKTQQPRARDSRGARRDVGVSDEVWEQLQKDTQAAQEREKGFKRLQEEARKASEADRDKIVNRLLGEERRRKEEAEIQQKLKQLGLCPMGYDWIKQVSGYRCAGGSHYISNE